MFETFAVLTVETSPPSLPPRWFDEPCGLVTYVAPEVPIEPEPGSVVATTADADADARPVALQGLLGNSEAPPPRPARARPRKLRRSLLAALAFVAGGLALSAIDRAWFRDRDRMPAAAPVPDPGGRVSRDDWQALLDGQRAMDARLTLLAPQPPAPAVDLKPLEQRLQAVSERVEGFGKQLEPVASLSVKVGGINDHLGAMDASLERLRNAIPRQMVALKPPAPVAAPAPAVTPVTVPAIVSGSGASARARMFALGAELFRARRYEELRETFRAGRASDPRDARVWYFAGLAGSLLSGRLDGDEAAALFRKGAALERSGKTSAAEVDSSFAFLAGTNEKAWLDFYRFGDDARPNPSTSANAPAR